MGILILRKAGDETFLTAIFRREIEEFYKKRSHQIKQKINPGFFHNTAPHHDLSILFAASTPV
jgi:hypothetical protein